MDMAIYTSTRSFPLEGERSEGDRLG
jgi:hypothetical protein